MMELYLLYESPTGYGLFKVHDLDVIEQNTEAVQSSVSDLSRFGRIVRLTSFHPFHQINTVSEGNVSEELIGFLKLNLPRVKGRNPNFKLGVFDQKIGSCIFEATKIPCQSNEYVRELLRGVHQHFGIFFKDLKPGDLEKAELELAQSYSTANVYGVDNHVIQATYLLDTLDKVINSFAMRVREWNSCHFPELDEIVDDNYLYARVSKSIEDKSMLSEEHIPMLTEVIGDEAKAKEIVEAGKTSIGQELSPVNMNNVQTFAQRVMDLEDYRKKLYDHLVTKMRDIAPNLVALIGDMIAARLISHAGSLRNLAKCPSSTLQILGVKKAFLSSLKTRGKNTPKNGLIFHSSFIQRTSGKYKGCIARSLASKCSIASRMDYFSDNRTSTFGEKLRKTVEERLEFCERGVNPCKNDDVMEEVLDNLDQKENEDITKTEEKDNEDENQLVYALRQSCLSEENVQRN